MCVVWMLHTDYKFMVELVVVSCNFEISMIVTWLVV